MTVNPEVYELERVAADSWRAYKMCVFFAHANRVAMETGRANAYGKKATEFMQAAILAEIMRKALLKGRKK